MRSPRIQVREGRDEDYAAIARLRNLNNPTDPRSAEELRHLDRAFSGPGLYRRVLLADAEGVPEPVAYATIDQTPFNFHPHKYWVHVSVAPELQGRGIGSELFGRLLAVARSRSALVLWAQVRLDHANGLAFFRRQGFVERRRFRRSRLDLSTIGRSPLPDRTEALAAEGIRFTTLAAAGPDRSEVRQRYYELHRSAGLDTPILGESTELSYEQFLRLEIEAPGRLAEGTVLAEAGGQYVGVTSLEHDPSKPDEVHVGFTGTLRGFRGKGIATELKRRSVEYARLHGYRWMTAGNDFANTAIWAINERLGFRTAQTVLFGERSLDKP